MEERSRDGLLLAAAGAGALCMGLLAARAFARRKPACGFRGRTVFITGGSRGLGLELARQFGAHGARVAICARDAGELERARQDLADRGVSAFADVCDVTDRVAVLATVNRIRERFGRIDVLVHNAGLIQVGPMETMTFDDYEASLKTHFWAALYAAEAVLPEMRSRGEGRIVNITSIGGKLGIPHLLPYCAGKHALVGFSEGLHAELAKDGIRVTTVVPGLIRTGSPRQALFKGRHREEYAWFSINDSLPVVSVSAGGAARRIVEACRRGDAELILSLPALLAVPLHGLFPGLTQEVLAGADRLLPRAEGGIGIEQRRGSESESRLSPSILTYLTDRAAERLNETG